MSDPTQNTYIEVLPNSRVYEPKSGTMQNGKPYPRKQEVYVHTPRLPYPFKSTIPLWDNADPLPPGTYVPLFYLRQDKYGGILSGFELKTGKA